MSQSFPRCTGCVDDCAIMWPARCADECSRYPHYNPTESRSDLYQPRVEVEASEPSTDTRESRVIFGHPCDGETRIIDPDTGGEKGSKLARFDLIPATPLEAVATHYGIGASKYADRNWERGYKWSLSFAAMMRHAWAFWRGEDIDPSNGSPHLAAVVFHALALMEYGRTHPEKDDRPAADAE